MKITDLQYKRDKNGKVIRDTNNNPIEEYITYDDGKVPAWKFWLAVIIIGIILAIIGGPVILG